MADSTTHLAQLVAAQAQHEVTANGLFDAGSPALIYGRRLESSAGLVWGYYGGRMGGAAVVNGTVTLQASVVQYMVVNRSTGVVSVSALPTNWVDPANYGRLYKVTAGASTVTSYEDHRFGKWGIWAPGIGGVVTGDKVHITIPVGTDLTTALTVASNRGYHRSTSRLLILEVRAALLTPSSSGAPAFDVKVNGATIFSTQITIDANEASSTTAAAAYALVSGGAHVDEESNITVDVTAAGTGAAGAVITLICLRGWADPAFEFLGSRLHFDAADASTTFTDVKGLTWTRSGSTQIDTAQSAFGGSSCLFNGSTDDLRSAASAVWNWGKPFTLRGWFRINAFPTNAHLVQIGTGDSSHMSLSFVSAQIAFWTVTTPANGAVRATSSATCSTGVWYYFEFTYDGTTFRLFQGTAGGTASLVASSTTTLVVNSDGQDICLGHQRYTGGTAANRLNGWLDEFDFYPGIALHTAAFPVPTRAAVDG